jgi:hypothetical protein
LINSHHPGLLWQGACIPYYGKQRHSEDRDSKETSFDLPLNRVSISRSRTWKS